MVGLKGESEVRASTKDPVQDPEVGLTASEKMAAMSEPTWEIPSDLRSQQSVPETASMWQKQGLWNE